MSKAGAILLCAIMLAGCFKPDPVVSAEYKWFIITDVKRPKHFRVQLKDAKTGWQYQKYWHVSKHCNRWREVRIGQKVYLREIVRQGANGNRYVSAMEGIRDVCPRY